MSLEYSRSGVESVLSVLGSYEVPNAGTYHAGMDMRFSDAETVLMLDHDQEGIERIEDPDFGEDYLERTGPEAEHYWIPFLGRGQEIESGDMPDGVIFSNNDSGDGLVAALFYTETPPSSGPDLEELWELLDHHCR